MSTAGDLLIDHDARSAIAGDLDRNLFVEAGAGTGKTTALVGRIVRLFATGRLAEPSQLAAITFTEAAAAQLRDRIRAALERAAAPAPSGAAALPDEERAACAAAARRIDEAVVTTLHGFAQGLLAEHPLAAGLPPAFEVDEGIPAELEFVDRWTAFVDGLLAEPDLEHDLRVAITLGLGLDRLGEVARRFHDRWDRLESALPAMVDPGPLPPADIGPIVSVLHDAVDIAAPLFGVDDKLVDRIEGDVTAVLERYEAALATGDPLEALRAVAAEPPPGHSRLGNAKVWGAERKAEAAAALDRAVGAHRDLLAGLRTGIVERLLPRLARFTLDWADERRRAGRLHFHDLLVLARRLLWSRADVRIALARRFRVLLVDEFQDTDPLQIELVVALAAADPSTLPARWDEVELAPGKVLVVGDPKQSIYAFRGADITLWNRTRERFGSDVVHLTQNFRSTGSILEWVNAVFSHLIGPGDADAQPAYTALAPHRTSLDERPDVVLLGGPADKGTRAAEVRLREAADVAAVVAALRREGCTVPIDVDGDGHPDEERPLRYDDIAILIPTRAPLGPIERALDDADIPYRVESRSLVWRTDVVRDLLSLLAAVEDPTDEVAVVATLRSPAFACTDAELLDWRQAGGRFDLTRQPPEDPSLAPRVAAAAEVLLRWHAERWSVPVDELVSRIVDERRLVALTFAQRRPRDHWRRLRFVIDQARGFVEAGGATLAQFLAWARLQTDEGATAVESIVPEPDDDAVRILTVHGSKGLEFPVVVLAGLATGPPPTITDVLWTAERPEVSFSVLGGGARFATAGHADAKDEADRIAAAESRRLLYVAATRAREQLVVSLHHGTHGTGGHAKELFAVCQGLAGTWRPPDLEAEPTLFDAAALGASPARHRARTFAEREAWRASWRAVVDAAARPWSVAPSSLGHVEPDDALPEPRPGVDDDEPRRRGGTAVGRAVHGVLERVDLDAPDPAAGVDELAAALAGEECVDAGTVAALARSALAGDAVAAARAAGRRWREVPVVAPVGDRLVEGFVDLLYETPAGGLVVVDWKTDAARTEAEVDAALDRYRLQGAGYALALEAALGRPVDLVRFVFCRAGGPPVERDVAGDALAAAVAEARALMA